MRNTYPGKVNAHHSDMVCHSMPRHKGTKCSCFRSMGCFRNRPFRHGQAEWHALRVRQYLLGSVIPTAACAACQALHHALKALTDRQWGRAAAGHPATLAGPI